MRICILETDRPAEPLQAAHGTYAGMFERWLAPHLPGAEYTHIHVAGGQDLPADPRDHSAYLITGSRAGVYEDHPWIAPLMDFLRAAASARRPLGGVCFGHQIMAAAFGGEVRRSATGWVLGGARHALSAAGAALFGPGDLAALSFHRDQVVALPDVARRILWNEASPNGGLIYDGFPAVSVQFHPEFSRGYVHDLLISAAGLRLAHDIVGPALETLDLPVEADRVARGFARVLRNEVGTAT
ncbi:type 1 glutamine amidotransferase [Defluviimonas sp. WL0075]|uniref:Type 1 glutamine amidotransferase n=1 Tax=Albidovulum sediminicola TaxID=2984331 RepID=A0ABT2Z6N6_9RHOB|nr:type 1 glutamine amidotransferase [Defluviimonas sp. WL0075]MCV2866805.1 type 1 glutamine amidotransferase [Defluviimonas sp. WL0075]